MKQGDVRTAATAESPGRYSGCLLAPRNELAADAIASFEPTTTTVNGMRHLHVQNYEGMNQWE
ncbi:MULTISPECIES: hypothetical protein [Streptomyces]|uniref:hypothetical protein n=1 Tax=Streptomyces TaxID=1883 RepID=UPI0021A57AE7|nr:hypothetical protein [Streptomyces atratus]MCT2543320.1 hypothetical protein [Streptomyces atratus]